MIMTLVVTVEGMMVWETLSLARESQSLKKYYYSEKEVNIIKIKIIVSLREYEEAQE